MTEPVRWHGCYNDSWQGVLVSAAFAHPAKVAPGLAWRIYCHMLDSGYIAPGDAIVDPFGGIGGFGYHAMLLGLHFTGCELEPRFVALAAENIEKWTRDLAMLNGQLGTARVLEGDSRRLMEVVGAGMAGVVSSPPFGGAEQHTGGPPPLTHNDGRNAPRVLNGMVHGKAPYGDNPGNLAALRADESGFVAAVSSPPYADMIDSWVEGAGARHDPVHHNGENAYKQSSDSGYGDTPGNIGHMSGGGFETMTDSESETFWSAARLIVEQTYAVLKPGGVAVWVCKDFVRGGRRVPFSDQWEQLCAAIGFESLERIQAMLVEEHAPQLDIFGGEFVKTVERKSFFRRLAERKGSPRIDWEDVLIMRKPGAAQ